MKNVLATWILARITYRVWFSATDAHAGPALPQASLPSCRLPARCCPAVGPAFSFQSGGLLIELKGQAGDVVKAGEVIARLDETPMRNSRCRRPRRRSPSRRRRRRS